MNFNNTTKIKYKGERKRKKKERERERERTDGREEKVWQKNKILGIWGEGGRGGDKVYRWG